jgi:NTP pyrophosphatase (non-canonical NTP hydrolase)
MTKIVMTTEEKLERDSNIFLNLVREELKRARKKFPNQDKKINMIALTEEVGELAQEILKLDESIKDPNNEIDIDKHLSRILNEAVQVACMACRVATEK